ncbi:hypothetical protein HF209_23255 [Pseudomonas sp. WS 5096]|jgi:hypothetical protein|uniref:Uncharacterized protein n=1 Tax=Pseudomonas cremoris TaxID=2724178 RepID=A0ABR6TD28_9PSED|nr:hypothetical protein [Pseudomonas cremoris]MBC2383864.1 hypothetical protein [Pseudomonas cremoris]
MNQMRNVSLQTLLTLSCLSLLILPQCSHAAGNFNSAADNLDDMMDLVFKIMPYTFGLMILMVILQIVRAMNTGTSSRPINEVAPRAPLVTPPVLQAPKVGTEDHRSVLAPTTVEQPASVPGSESGETGSRKLHLD